MSDPSRTARPRATINSDQEVLINLDYLIRSRVMQYLTVVQVAEKLGVSVVTVRRRIRSGALRAYKNGGVLRINKNDLKTLTPGREAVGWGNLSADSFVRDWNNPYDAVYDDWRKRRVSSAR